MRAKPSLGFGLQLGKSGFTLNQKRGDDKAVEDFVFNKIDTQVVAKQRSRMNAGLIGQIMRLSKESLDTRLDLEQLAQNQEAVGNYPWKPFVESLVEQKHLLAPISNNCNN